MIHEVDEALRALLRAEAMGQDRIAVVFDAPTRDWASKINAPTVNLYLYDIREDMRLRQRGLYNEYDERGAVVARRRPPRFFKLSYLITAWTKRPEDEHRLLSSLLSCFLRHEALPGERLTGTLADIGLAVPMTIALPPPEDRSFADVWSALGGELKPSLDLVVSVPVTEAPVFPAGPPVEEEAPRVHLGDVPERPTTMRGLPLYGRRPFPQRERAARAARAARDQADRDQDGREQDGHPEQGRPEQGGTGRGRTEQVSRGRRTPRKEQGRGA